MSDKKTKNETRILIYIDILGTKEIYKSGNKVDLEEVIDAFSSFNPPNNIYIGEKKEPETIEKANFSDHIVVSYSVHEIDIISSVLRPLSALCFNALTKGILVRGAITIGELFHDGNRIRGKALIEAAEMEQDIAIYPRIVVSHHVVSHISKFVLNNVCDFVEKPSPGFDKTLNSIFKFGTDSAHFYEESDGVYYFSWLNLLFSEIPSQAHVNFVRINSGATASPESDKVLLNDIYNTLYQEKIDSLKEIKKLVEEVLKNKANPKILIKWRKMAFYFNESLLYFKNLIQTNKNITEEINKELEREISDLKIQYQTQAKDIIPIKSAENTSAS